ncbi:hypothetical protein FGO68_gene16613 [Halteria grandinella]|uniref:Phosphatidic acid phosphatase type 2/haloperoxidase domain-containing protein n=1 Tax=Halteria grandinella TaxID=5974 RepID=A0A8J8P285_HALGN|nr:hypothetical protein FGO68_gene16613 [Halteria grandinella]
MEDSPTLHEALLQPEKDDNKQDLEPIEEFDEGKSNLDQSMWQHKPTTTVLEAKRHIQELYGDQVKAGKYTNLSATSIFTIGIIMFTMVPIEIFLRDFLSKKVENPIIVTLQQHFISPSLIIDLANRVLDLTEVETVRYVLFALYLSGDAILATKSALVTFFGEFLLVMLQITYKEPRPFWTSPMINSYRCQSDFEGPSDHLFILGFLPTYLNLLYLRKYSRVPKRSLSRLCFALQGVCIIGTLASGLMLGHTYIFQGIIGLVYGFIYTVICLQFDAQLHLLVEKSIFLQKKARKYKFEVLFFTIGLLVVASVLFCLQLHDLGRPPNLWTSNYKAKCPTGPAMQLGMKATFRETSVLVCIPTMVFASAFAVTLDGDLLYWSNSRRVVLTRQILGLSLALLIDLIFIVHPLQSSQELPTVYFLHYILPYVLTTFTVYGLTPPLAAALCSDTVDEDARRKRRVFQSETTSSSSSEAGKRGRIQSGSETVKQKSSSTSKQQSSDSPKKIVNLRDLQTMGMRDRMRTNSDIEKHFPGLSQLAAINN